MPCVVRLFSVRSERLTLEPSEAGLDRPNPRVDLSFQAPSESGATELARTLESYLEVPSALRLRPPCQSL